MIILAKSPLIVIATFLIINCCYADIGIITALNSSMTQLKNDLKITQITQKAKREFYSGILEHENVVVVRSPMGKVNNAITTQTLLSNFPIDTVISLSPAGSTDTNIKIGDMIIASKVYQHDFGTIKPYGFIWKKVPDGTGRDEPGYNIPDHSIVNKVLRFAKKNFTHNKNSILPGVIVSGDQFISSISKKKWLNKKFSATAVDMGAGAIAQVCFANQVSFCLLRVITDNAGVAARTDFNKSVHKYHSDINIHKFLKGVLHELKSKNSE